MTGTYEWNPMPHKVDVKCPHCYSCSEFEFVEICRIKNKADIDFFKNSSLFDYHFFQNSCGHYWHGALFYAGLHGTPTSAIHTLPAGYEPSNWNHSKYLHRSHGLDLGSIRCENCHFRAKTHLQWPNSAYFTVTYKNKILWAFNRESAHELNEFIFSKNRNISKYRWRSFLLHIPTIFKTHNAREVISKKLVQLLTVNTNNCSNNSFNRTPNRRSRSGSLR